MFCVSPDLPRRHVFSKELDLHDHTCMHREKTFKVKQEQLEVPGIKEQQKDFSIVEVILKEEPEDLEIKFSDGNNTSSTETVVNLNPEVSELQAFHTPPCPVSQDLTGQESENSRSRRPKRKNANRDFNQKNIDNDVTVTKPSTGKRRCKKAKNESKVKKKRKSLVDTKTPQSSRRGAALQHKISHTVNKPYSCLECGRGFLNTLYLQRHMKIHFDTGRRHVCSTCNKRFLCKSHLKDHKAIHTGVKSHVCDVCNRSFLLKKNLTKHMKIHTDERPHVCQTCGKAFLENRDLRKHVEVHAAKKRFACKECGKCFSGSFTLTHHVASAHYYL